MTELDDLRFPIGRFNPPASNDASIRGAQIETLRMLPERLRGAVNGLSDAQLDTPYREGGWTVRQVCTTWPTATPTAMYGSSSPSRRLAHNQAL